MDAFVWDIDPEIFRFYFFAPRYYGLLFAIGFLVGYQIMKKIFLEEGRSEEDLSSLLLHLMLGTIIGARLGHCLFYQPEYYLRNPLEILMIWKGGLASHGGSIGVLFAVWLYKRKHPDQPYIWLADRLSIGVAFTAACIRLGNFFNSEIIGTPTDLPWAVVFARIDSIPRHPAMLYESLSYLTLFGVLWFLYRRQGPNIQPGRLIGLMLVWVFGSRFFIEFVKENQVPFEERMLLNMGQWLSIPFVLLGLILLSGLYAQWFPALANRAEQAQASQRQQSRQKAKKLNKKTKDAKR
jgi:prolipoprotein diacylglyceryl transferase